VLWAIAFAIDKNVTNFTEWKMAETSKLRQTSCYWAEEYATLQLGLHRNSHAEVKKFPLAYVMLF